MHNTLKQLDCHRGRKFFIGIANSYYFLRAQPLLNSHKAFEMGVMSDEKKMSKIQASRSK